MILTSNECCALNYMISELTANSVKFRFVDPFNDANKNTLRWVSGVTTVEAVSSIIDHAIDTNSVVLVGSINSETWNSPDSDAFFVGYTVDIDSQLS